MQFFLIILCAWALAAGAGAGESLREYVRGSQYRQAYGVYLQDKKVGWAVTEVRLGKHKGKEVAECVSEMHMRMQMGGEASNSDSVETDWFSLEGRGEFLGAQERQLENKLETRRSVARKGDTAVITTRSAGDKRVRTVPLPKEDLEINRAMDRWLTGPPKPGETFENWSTDWSEDKVDRREVYTYKGRRSIVYEGAPLELCVVSVNMDGMDMECLLLPDQQMFKGKIGGLFEIRAEPEAMAKDLTKAAAVDYLKALAIEADRDLGAAEGVNRLVLEMQGLEGFQLPASHRQVVKPESADRARLELRRDFRVREAAPLSAEQRREYLRATVSVQAGEKDILSLCKKIVGSEREPVEVSRKIVGWIQKNLRQVQGANAATALEVLRTKQGDCTEHSLLFVTLARAAGIPAREVGGVAFGHGDKPRFYWHEWAEIHDGHQWVTVDPTWDEINIDATHIKFTENIEDWSWVNLLGKLKIKVLEVERR